MARFIKKQKQEIGLSPDALYFRGKKKIDKVLLRVIDFDPNNLEENPVNTVKEVLKYKDKNTVTWFNIDGLHNEAIMEEIAQGFKLDRLILAEVMDTQTRAKVHEYANCIYISIKMLQQDEQTNTISVENLSLLVTETVIISFQEKKGDVFEPVRERIRNQKKRIRNSGTDYLAFALLDIVVDNYIYIISILGDKIEDLENNLLLNPNQKVIDEINAYKRELNFLRKNINPAKEMILTLSKMESDFINEGTYIHYKELLDNINQATESSDSYREILSDQLNIYHTTISSRLNDIMKFLTVFSVIFIPLTFIAGIYGTNFDVVPELHYKYSYFIMWGVMIVLVVVMLIYFKRKKWL
ncbi:magnesium/cobalt transporter CorA [Arenibacter sp. 6A1]|uniref:magnesium/cobalt transporter CorA n=1 Tax=Arenibacter sp. 6A1 TaxID=2720391 RepID=UPI0014478A10|nr:magnesium/cobalt transporter CorA [Arenibacter sp. 6A1]NKI25838.1 magnesium/cobalt transporter CorA [Arenibacter sp. 6A1]